MFDLHLVFMQEVSQKHAASGLIATADSETSNVIE